MASKQLSRALSILGIIAGLSGMVLAFTPLRAGAVGEPLGVLAFILGIVTLFIRPRDVALSIGALIASAPVILFIVFIRLLGFT